MTEHYLIFHNKIRIAYALVVPQPETENYVVLIIPRDRTGSEDDDSLIIHLKKPYTDSFSNTIDVIEAIKNVLAQAEIEEWKVEVRSVNTF